MYISARAAQGGLRGASLVLEMSWCTGVREWRRGCEFCCDKGVGFVGLSFDCGSVVLISPKKKRPGTTVVFNFCYLSIQITGLENWRN